MKTLIELVLKNSATIQRFCDIGAKFILIAIGGLLIRHEILEKSVIKAEESEKTVEKIGFKVSNK